MKKLLNIAMLLAIGTTTFAQKDTIRVEMVKAAGPFIQQNVLTTTEKDANDKAYDQHELHWEIPMDMNMWKKAASDGVKELHATDSTGFVIQEKGIYQLGFTIDNNQYQKVSFIIKTKGKNALFVDGKQQSGEVALIAGRHDCVLKLQQKEEKADTVEIKVVTGTDTLWTAHFAGIRVNEADKRTYTLNDHMTGQRLSTASISADGRFVLENTYITRADGKNEWTKYIVDLQTGNRYQPYNFVQWAAKGGKYISRTVDQNHKCTYEYRDVISGQSEHLYTHPSQESLSFVAMDTKIIVRQSTEGKKELHNQVRQILEPNDRLPGWRNRSFFSVIDVKTGVRRQITTGLRSTGGTMSNDGKLLYISVSDDVANERPYYFTMGMLMNLETGKVDTLFHRDGFVRGAQFSPDSRKLLFTGTPEAFGGIGNVCPEGMIPNNYEYELFLMDLDTKKIEPITKKLDPSISSVHWSLADNHLYAVCENKDLVSVFRMDMAEKKGHRNGKWEMLQLNEPNIKGGISLAKEKPVMVYTGLSGETTDHSWVLDLKKNKHTSLTDLNPTRLDGIALGKCLDWTYRTERGDSITGCYYLPPYFDETKQYPMLVYYYGGVTPVGRVLESPYNYQAWAAMGYVVYVLQPSGCIGFGQEFAARHSNAWGDYTADDIINGTKQFIKEHSFVNPKKIGCMGASYGGFMTQYLQTRTDIFAAAMSHAGISSIASYWGEGNWGYTYSAAASPNSYPWNNTKLYTEHAPLFNAHKVNTPILFMHGTVDNNVPMGESIQMFNALKILGKETAFIMVDGENHYIADHHKRIRWHDSIMAWFQKWLQDDPTWWNDMYPEKNL
ncbi:MAG: S9 family peptidase [Bacteroidaceae bacterium]|nr:S9 family peptidase [Bacteroidaceae bacterium]